ncbi:MAG: hypothetical protein KIT31_39675, partial [Deltaproteobacteria bacterium]|nr:hypothetical protein [Deltaproteobacteria bacterium]
MRWAVLLVLAACATRQAAPAEPGGGRDLASYGITAAALRFFADSPNDGTGAMATAGVPPGERSAVVRQVLREGNLGCGIRRRGCRDDHAAWPEPWDDATRPCFRRWLVLAVVATLRPEDRLVLDADNLPVVARLDDVVVAALAGRLSEEQRIELAHARVLAKRDVPFRLVPLSTENAARAVGAYHLEDAVRALALPDHAALLESVARDRTFAPSTRADALRILDDAAAPWVRELLADASCEVAGVAASLVAR